MEILVTGGSGFVGRALGQGLRARGHQVTVLTRSAKAAQGLPEGVGFCLGDPGQPGPWQEEAARHQGFINLAGASIFGRWTEAYKRQIHDSRVRTTRHLVQAIARRPADQPPAVLISASAVGYYGFHGDEVLDEVGSCLHRAGRVAITVGLAEIGRSAQEVEKALARMQEHRRELSDEELGLLDEALQLLRALLLSVNVRTGLYSVEDGGQCLARLRSACE